MSTGPTISVAQFLAECPPTGGSRLTGLEDAIYELRNPVPNSGRRPAKLKEIQEYCRRNGIQVSVTRIHEVLREVAARRLGVLPRQPTAPPSTTDNSPPIAASESEPQSGTAFGALNVKVPEEGTREREEFDNARRRVFGSKPLFQKTR